MTVPKTRSEITTDWLNSFLSEFGVVDDCSCSGLGAEEQGFLSTMARAELTWHTPDECQPQAVIIKMRPPHGEFENISDRIHTFEREVRFYQEIAPTVPTRLPRIYYTSLERGNEIIVMEDLSWMTPCDQVEGMPHDWIAHTVAEMGSLQSRYWDTKELANLKWMPWEWKDDLVSTTGHEEWEAFRTRWSDLVGPRGLEIAERVEHARDWIDDRIRSRPKTIVHSDLRADNILMDESGPEPRACIIDWQITTRGIGASDVAHLLGGSDTPADRSGHHIEVLRAWHDALLSGGVHGYTFEEAVEDLLLASLVKLRIPAFIAKLAVADSEEDTRSGQLVQAIVTRYVDFVDEIDALRVLPGRS